MVHILGATVHPTGAAAQQARNLLMDFGERASDASVWNVQGTGARAAGREPDSRRGWVAEMGHLRRLEPRVS